MTRYKTWFRSALFAGIVLALSGCSSSHRPGGGGSGTDADGDGYEEGPDCDDGDPSIHPGADERCSLTFECGASGDYRDNDCDGVVDDGCPIVNCFPYDGGPDSGPVVDADADGYDVTVDCNDADPAIHPGADESCCDMIDSDCDGMDDPAHAACNCFYDADGDGYGYGFGPGPDCDDTNPMVHPGAEDLCCDGLDADCDGFDGSSGGDCACAAADAGAGGG